MSLSGSVWELLVLIVSSGFVVAAVGVWEGRETVASFSGLSMLPQPVPGSGGAFEVGEHGVARALEAHGGVGAGEGSGGPSQGIQGSSLAEILLRFV